ncbi:MAG: helix-turn-helix transcriptional regulator [Psychrilyobacter sp.]|uniref:helix-turn-helix domain-containing protein n=1 Tax=Psychrilyobacter sp. TaxID=2586924 RepID=UPI003C71500B
MKKKFDVPEEKRRKLGEFIKKLRLEKKYGFNQFALKAQINVADLNRLEKGEKKKINAYQLMNIASAFKIDYKKLYKMIGYMEKEDFNTKNEIEKVNENTELSVFTELVNSLPKDDMKKMLQEYLEKKELEAYKNGTFEEKKEHFDLIKKAIENGVEE